ncbi:MAG: translational GTPase TypA [Bacteroidetes bacterium]|nr:translational GTPase TypA [Bacteroidota bacterium]MBM3423924.1 translational GTPase TypA [Bacteroidota bacterium]
MEIRNIAIIAHVDHGKTTLVDKIISAGSYTNERDRPIGELILDNNDLERERGITIVSKNVSVSYRGTKINIIDTPGHADFGGEVERVLNMADGVCLLVDAFEGPMPQTRFVLGKALAMGIKPLLVINKVDKENCTPDEVHEKVFDLMFELDATEEQLDFPTVYGSAKNGWMSFDWRKPTQNIEPLLDTMLSHFKPRVIPLGNTQLLITSLDYSTYVGRIAIGRLSRGTLCENQMVQLAKRDGTLQKHKIRELYIFEGLERRKVVEVMPGDLCAMTGLEGFDIGDSVCDADQPEPLETIKMDEPTMSMLFTINDSPFFGKEGKFVTSRHLQERLMRELEKNLALRVMETDKADRWIVHGRGVLHLSILIETMRREGYELQVGQPQVIFKELEGQRCEPMEDLTIDLPEEFGGTAVEAVSKRKGELKIMQPKGNRMIMQFQIPSRGIIGLRSYLLTQTAGEAIVTHRFLQYEPFKGDIPGRQNGSLISLEQGMAIPYSINNLQERGRFFINPNESIYEGQVIGENSRAGDMVVNVTKTKKLTNMRASGSDDKVKIVPAKIMSLEETLEYIQQDEFVEITPKNLRIRKIFLKEADRRRLSRD